MNRAFLSAAVALVLAASAARAQETSDDLLQQSRDLYERLEIERALSLLRRVISPDWPLPVTDAQRVEAYKYLGASLALIGRRDSATSFFRAALERDPFTDLDAARFTPDQLSLFGVARRLTFAVGIRAGSARQVDPRTERVTFTSVTTHRARLLGTVRFVPDSGAGVTLFDGTNEGARDIIWNGLDRDGRLARPGRYEVIVIGTSQLVQRVDTARAYFDLAHQVEPLEDTLPPLVVGEVGGLLPERYRPASAGLDLMKGLGVAAGGLLISGALTDDRLGRGSHARWMAAASVGVGVLAFTHRTRHPERPENVAINDIRRLQRRSANEEIRQRNAQRLARTLLVVTPAAGIGVGP